MAWFLVLILSGHGKAMTTIEVSSESACQKYGQSFVKGSAGWSEPPRSYFCMPNELGQP